MTEWYGPLWRAVDATLAGRYDEAERLGDEALVLIRRYVGVGPKWVLKRLRIHHAAEQLTAASPPRWTELALDLGSYDHAHFIRDFRLVVGRSPAEYAAEAARARDGQIPASNSGSASRSA